MFFSRLGQGRCENAICRMGPIGLSHAGWMYSKHLKRMYLGMSRNRTERPESPQRTLEMVISYVLRVNVLAVPYHGIWAGYF